MKAVADYKMWSTGPGMKASLVITLSELEATDEAWDDFNAMLDAMRPLGGVPPVSEIALAISEALNGKQTSKEGDLTNQ